MWLRRVIIKVYNTKKTEAIQVSKMEIKDTKRTTINEKI